MAQWIVLIRIGGGAVRGASELCYLLHYASGAMKRLFDRLEQAGLIARRPSRHDARAQTLALPARGEELYRRLRRIAVDVLHEHLRGISRRRTSQSCWACWKDSSPPRRRRAWPAPPCPLWASVSARGKTLDRLRATARLSHAPRQGWSMVAGPLVQGLAVELAPRARVNAVAPTWTPTPLWHFMTEADVAVPQERFAKNIPLGRSAAIDDVAQAYLFLMQCALSSGRPSASAVA